MFLKCPVVPIYFEPTVDIREPDVFICSTGLKIIPTSADRPVQRRRKCEE